MLLNQLCKNILQLCFSGILTKHSVTNFYNVILSLLLLDIFLKLSVPLVTWLFENFCFIYIFKKAPLIEKNGSALQK